jgi:hypothetical protein
MQFRVSLRFRRSFSLIGHKKVDVMSESGHRSEFREKIQAAAHPAQVGIQCGNVENKWDTIIVPKSWWMDIGD